MKPILLTPFDLIIASSLVVLDAVVSVLLGLRLHKQILVAAARCTIQLLLIGFLLRFVFAIDTPALTLGVILVMVAIAGREVAARPEKKLARYGNQIAGLSAVALATFVTAIFALATALRPHPWYDARYAIPLAGIMLGNALNAASLSLDALLSGVMRERSAIEAQLALGTRFRDAMRPLIRASVRRGILPIINTMSAAGIVTLPGIMTGQILAGLDPVEAVKYQILLMFLLAGANGIAAVGAAYFAAARLTDSRERLRVDRLK
ncbi:iron export ABC transporter permease subunit FetB [Acidiphilium sp. AL]|uniref:Iron export ABC transporter permease subunit FetB n=1 Tax=Acidiphilium iwatense TaxID=768198 RepID=A0ABS9DVA8_9PROT|nr:MULTISPECIES: iron export ABC transporter permease subunit FetB [Acidiphilium]MCF3946667.1 iron export ABC transporter permease subunit FetB [Acidiphilium iwatense]MCU4159992.1 iron export ABC transporter permease subunit FetB [Acidiphilium sp. AL]